jgi:general secretion pathway protein H
VKKQGFTFVEILVVIFIVGLLASVVFVRGATTGTQEIKTTIARLRSLFVYTQQQALLKTLTLQFSIDRNLRGYQFLKYHPATEKGKAAWEPIKTDKLLNHTTLPANVVLVASPKTIVFFPNGEMLPFQIDFYFKGKKSHYHLQGKENGELVINDDRA